MTEHFCRLAQCEVTRHQPVPEFVTEMSSEKSQDATIFHILYLKANILRKFTLKSRVLMSQRA